MIGVSNASTAPSSHTLLCPMNTLIAVRPTERTLCSWPWRPELSPHHKRTRSGGEQRGITGKATQPGEAATLPFLQVSARTSRKCSQLPKLRVLVSLFCRCLRKFAP
jgi:hypothetical protein